MTELANIRNQSSTRKAIGGVRISYSSIAPIAATVDAVAVAVSGILGVALYSFYWNSNFRALDLAFGVIAIALIMFYLITNRLGLYTLQALLAPVKCFHSLIIATIIMAVSLITILYLLHIGSQVPRTVVAYVIFMAVVFLALSRLMFGRYLNRLLAEGGLIGRRVVIIGEESELERLTPSRLLLSFGLNEVSRVVIPSVGQLESAGADATAAYAIRLARERNAEEVAVAIAWNRVGLLERVNAALRASPLPVRLLPDHAVSRMMDEPHLSLHAPIASIELQRAPLSVTQRRVKRTLDISIAFAALLPLSPVMLLAALAIKLDSPGPILFRQQRTGFDGDRFRIHKFRTMTVLEDGAEVRQARAEDARVTRVGSFLRRTSIDELPQLINVLVGDMSLVGPRPHAVAHDQQYRALISKYAFRFHVKPGITGWAQVNGLRGETLRLEEMERRIEFDLWYINNWSFGLDFWILLRTVLEVVRQRAY